MTPSSSKTNFFLGFGAALAAVFAVGFFILLGIILQRKESNAFVRSNSDPLPTGAAAQAPQPSNPGQPAAGPVTLASVTAKDWVQGNRNAKVSVVEFSDTECPFCKRFHPTMQQVVATYGGKVNWVYRHFPLTSLHSKASKEAEATECAGELGGNDGFWKYLDRLFTVTPSNNGLDPAQLPTIAQDVGLNRSKFQACLDSGKYAQKVQDHLAQAGVAGCNGTPCSIVVAGDQKISVSGAVPFEQLKAIIDPLVP